ncbi:type 2 lanthipeptide synthetase LanM family protein [Haloarcula salina]|uniref:Type 2 lantipeptide synthetase LanM family protein n=1 Tax=Haloarcula salina TaxID=1429914 RepID=A0AA41KJM8_9EURY|nr:type 2 lanthipeptide synthetase LanM family protein [Haloarcula salina]MBV0901044.1 type 2 lantipeptide synthetase LanM family protein [Haloarcula salina]
MEHTFTVAERRELAGRARTIHERLSNTPNDPGPEPPIEPEEILAEWQDKFSDTDAFSDRLDDLTDSVSTVYDQLAATHWPEDESLPDWVDVVDDVVRFCHQNEPDRIDSTPDDEPFRDFLEGIVTYARRQLPDDIPHAPLEPMSEWLVGQLSLLTRRALFVEFKSFVEYNDSELADADPTEYDDPPRKYYRDFIHRMYEHGFQSLCLEYPVLARQLALCVDQWISAVRELFDRLATDRDEIGDQFGIAGDLIAVKPLSEDAHRHNRIPVRCLFETGSVVYKPRDVDGARVLYTVLSRLDSCLSSGDFSQPELLSRDGYGWMEALDYADLESTADVREYYERAGSLTCVAYCLNLTDCQYENVLVDGEQPQIVDGETVFHPHTEATAMPTPSEIVRLSQQSILSTLLVPWSMGESPHNADDDTGVSHAGLGRSSSVHSKEVPRPEIRAANTDVMTVEEVYPEVDMTTNTVTVDSTDHPPGQYISELRSGFLDAYDTIAELHAKGRFFDEVAPTELVENVETRFVYRATAEYGSILHLATGRDQLRDGARLSVEFEQLAAPFFDGQIDDRQYLDLFAAERRALRRRDIPRFATSATDPAIRHDGESIGVEVSQSGYSQSKQLVGAMTAADRKRQAWLLEYAFRPTVSGELPGPIPDTAPFETVARTCFERVLDAAAQIDDRRQWVSISPTNSGLEIYPTDVSLYHGRGGIALAAAALSTVTEMSRYEAVASELLEPLLAHVSAADQPASLGGTLGIGSIIYTFTVVASLTGSAEYRSAATDAIEMVTEPLVSEDRSFDVMEGAAGTLLALLAHHDRFGGGDVLDRAVLCGERLLEGRISVDGHQTWQCADDEPPLTSFAHGSSGCAYALARLAEKTDESRFEAAAREAIAFERSLFDPERCNWAKSPREEEYVDKWCHGRTGIALGRLGTALALDEDTFKTDAIDAFSAITRGDGADMDHLCCGNLGRSEAMLVGARRTGMDREDAETLVRRSLARQQRDGIFSMTGHATEFANPTFFHGLAGVTYELLRFRRPDTLPSVLLFE